MHIPPFCVDVSFLSWYWWTIHSLLILLDFVHSVLGTFHICYAIRLPSYSQWTRHRGYSRLLGTSVEFTGAFTSKYCWHKAQVHQGCLQHGFPQIVSSIRRVGLTLSIVVGLCMVFETLLTVVQSLGKIRRKWSIPPFHKKSWGQYCVHSIQ